jgi:hypothetical protein
MNLFNTIWQALKAIGKFFTSKAAKSALELVISFIPQVSPIVDAIRKIVPNVGEAKLADILTAYQAFGISIQNIRSDPKEFAGYLAELALTVARQRLKADSTPERILNAAIEMALVELKAK